MIEEVPPILSPELDKNEYKIIAIWIPS